MLIKRRLDRFLSTVPDRPRGPAEPKNNNAMDARAMERGIADGCIALTWTSRENRRTILPTKLPQLTQVSSTSSNQEQKNIKTASVNYI